MKDRRGWDGRDVSGTGDLPPLLAHGLRAEMGMLEAYGGVSFSCVLDLKSIPIIQLGSMMIDCEPYSWKKR